MYDARKDVRAFIIGNDQDTGISLGKRMTTPGEVHLVIGLGGAGTDMLLETKGMINKYCCSDNDQNRAPERVAYLAFDIDREVFEKTSSSETRNVRLNEEETVQFCRERLNGSVKLGGSSWSIKEWIPDWVDKRIRVEYHEDSLEAHRDVDRLLMLLDIDTVISKIGEAMRKLLRGSVSGENRIKSFAIDILTGLSGGTGSGVFLDMAIIARKIAAQEMYAAGITWVEPKVCGYFLLPEAALLKADYRTVQFLLSNGVKALHALEDAMQKARRGESCLYQYSESFSVNTDKAPFDFVYLISPCRDHGEDAYKKCIDSAACSILSFLTYADHAEAARAYMQHSAMQGMLYQMNPGTDFTYCYTGLSHAEWEIPPDYIMKCIFTAVFKEFNDDRFFTEPVQEDADSVFSRLGLSLEQVMKPVRSPFWSPLDGYQFKSGELFGADPVDLKKILPPEGYIRSRLEYEINGKALREVEMRLEAVVRESFTDPKKGPHWTKHLLLTDHVQGYKGLDELVFEEKRRAEDACRHLRRDADQMQEKIEEYLSRARGSLIYRMVDSRRKEYVEMWNKFTLMKAQLIYLELLLAKGTGFYDRVRFMIEKCEREKVRAGCEVLEEIRNVTAYNIDSIRNLKDQSRQHQPEWNMGIIPELYDEFRREFENISSARFGSWMDIAMSFLDKLYEECMESAAYINSYSFSGLFRDFLGRWAELFQIPLEKIVLRYFGSNYPLDSSVKNELIPSLVEKARRKLDVGQGGIYGEMVIVPSKYHDNGLAATNARRVPRSSLIDSGAENYCLNANGPGRPFEVLSCLRYRIGVVSWRFGMALSDLNIYQRYEEAMRR